MDNHPPVAWYREVTDNNNRLEDISQLFLGQRIQCARVPPSSVGEVEPEGLLPNAAFLLPGKNKTGISPDEPIVYSAGAGTSCFPSETGESLKPAGLDGPVLERQNGNRSSTKVGRLDDKPRDNAFFAKSLGEPILEAFHGTRPG